MRIACLFIPDLPLVATLRAQPQLARAPLAVVQGKSDLGGRALVLATTAEAGGVAPGMTLAEARSLCPGLTAVPESAERNRAAAQAAVEAAQAISPRVEEAAPGLVYLDAEGLSALWGGARRAQHGSGGGGVPPPPGGARRAQHGSEHGVAHALTVAAERVGLCAAVGLAEGKPCALLAARSAAFDVQLEATARGVAGGAFRVVPRDEQAAFLAALPLIALHGVGIDSDLLATLQRFGLTTLGDLARLPPGPLAARLGGDVAALHRLARGDAGEALAPQKPADRFEEGEELEWDASSVEPLLFVWKALLDRLCSRLASRGLMAREIELHLRLSDGSWDVRSLDLSGPTREAPALLQLLRLSVEGRPPQSGVRAMRLVAVPAREVLDQLPLFGPRTASPTQLAAAVARLSALVGQDRVGAAAPIDTYRPFAAKLERFAPPPPDVLPQRPAGSYEVPLAARALRPPREAEVRCDDEGRPLLVIGEGALGGRVVASAGPWRTVAEWWTDAPLALDSYDLEIAGGLLLRASRELASGAWWIEAVYD